MPTDATDDLISIHEAARRGIVYVRRPIWANPLDHLKINILPDGVAGPWTHLYAPFNQECNGKDPVPLLVCVMMDYDVVQWVPYTGPLADSEAYRAEQQKYAGCLKDIHAN